MCFVLNITLCKISKTIFFLTDGAAYGRSGGPPPNLGENLVIDKNKGK